MSERGTDPGPAPGAGRRAGARRGTPSPRAFQPRLLVFVAGAVVALAGWAALVVAAIHFGRTARGDSGGGWALLVVTSLGAVGCLFLALMLVTMLLRRVGLLAPRADHRH